jgi:hypothetical protein
MANQRDAGCGRGQAAGADRRGATGSTGDGRGADERNRASMICRPRRLLISAASMPNAEARMQKHGGSSAFSILHSAF